MQYLFLFAPCHYYIFSCFLHILWMRIGFFLIISFLSVGSYFQLSFWKLSSFMPISCCWFIFKNKTKSKGYWKVVLGGGFCVCCSLVSFSQLWRRIHNWIYVGFFLLEGDILFLQDMPQSAGDITLVAKMLRTSPVRVQIWEFWLQGLYLLLCISVTLEESTLPALLGRTRVAWLFPNYWLGTQYFLLF